MFYDAHVTQKNEQIENFFKDISSPIQVLWKIFRKNKFPRLKEKEEKEEEKSINKKKQNNSKNDLKVLIISYMNLQLSGKKGKMCFNLKKNLR